MSLKPAIYLIVKASLLLAITANSVLAEETVRFSRQVLPILSDRCFSCHGPDEADREADLRLDQQESATEDRGDYAVVVPGDPKASELMVRITSSDADLKMPPPDSHRQPLTAKEIATIEQWIAQGAQWEGHWAFEKPKRPELPDTAKHPIDAFVERRLEQEGLELSPLADRQTLIRRATLDLIGLPPTPQEVGEYLADEAPDAYEKLVDRLLASPHYGERMAWPWLDAARYADTAGFQGDPRRSMWPWRDWVINALNQNMPFDQFTIEQLAGDLLPEATPEQRLATGFNRNHMYNSEGGRIAEETRVENVFDRLETTGTVWLGLTLQCARCHDHKFDPTTAAEYFAFYDFYNQTSEDGKNNRSEAVPPQMEYATIQAGDVKVMVMDTLAEPRKSFILTKGIYDSPTEQQVEANIPAMLPPLPPQEAGTPYNRLDLARWLVSPEHPLTARVTVNRFWQTFFGQGIVKSIGDFGLQGAQPTHPDLLDWLAANFIESGWDVKQLHKLIVTSATYRQQAIVTPKLLERDPTNALLARAPRRRLPSWMLRDQVLALSGLLDSTLGGPPVKPYQPSGIWAEATFDKIRYEQDKGAKLYRRSLYIFWRRIVGPTMFFDTSKRQTCEVKLNLTNTPLHALTTLNDITYVEAARVLAERIIKQYPTTAERVEAAFTLITARPPEAEELSLLTNRLETYVVEFQNRREDAERLVSVGEAPRDEAVDLAEHAAYATLLNTLFNLDETLVKP